MKRTGEASTSVDALADEVFAVLTDVAALPSWAARRGRVVELPDALAEGAEWVVEMEVVGRRFRSRSHVIELDPQERRFAYRSKREDDNPSFSVWTWDVLPEGDDRARVTLAWELRPVTFLRKRPISWVRDRHIRFTEAPASLAGLAGVCASRLQSRS